MRAEVIAIGDELITGQRLDTNSQWLAERLTECGVDIAFHTTIGDDLADNVTAFQQAVQRVDVVVATGGLGPTADDLTREALASVANVELVRDEAALAHIRQLFAHRGRPMPERNAVQADFPAGAAPIANEFGTAPGIAMRFEREGRAPCDVFALPGVPAEMKPMWYASVAPAILARQPAARVTRHRLIKCFGVGESQLESMLPDLIRRGREPRVGITVSDATITLRITASGVDEAACQAAMEPTVAVIREALGTLVFGEGDVELENVVADMLARQDKSLAVVELATGGLIEDWLSAAAEPGAGRLHVGVVAADARRAGRLLALTDAERRQLDSVAPHDSAVATVMAEALLRQTGADVALTVAAFPPNLDGPAACVYAAIADGNRTRRLRFGCAAHPAIRRPRTAKQALNALRLALLGVEPNEG